MLIMDNNLSQDTLHEQINRAQRELTLLYEISNAMRTTLELNRILYIILTGVTSHSGLGFNRAILFLVNPQGDSLEPKMAIGPESGEEAKEIWQYIVNANQHLDDLIREEKVDQNTDNSAIFNAIKTLKIPLNNDEYNPFAQAYFKGEPKHITTATVSLYAHTPFFQVFKTNELVIMPLKAKDKVIGLITADNLFTQKNITPEDLRIFTMLANQAGLAIENSRLYEMVKHKSNTDSLTELWNHGFFQEKILEQIELHRKDGSHLSLLMLDIDDFKKLNDTFGHQKGDVVIIKIADILKHSARADDYVCRYGGEEFAILLPLTNKEEAHKLAEEIRKKVELNLSNHLITDQAYPITLSLGLASFPPDAQNKEELIAKADKAMYIAKFSGKNQTVLAE